MTRTLVPTPHILQSVPKAFPPVGQSSKREVDHLALSSSEPQTYVEQYLHFPHTF
jgi:hypothetical protein